MSHAQVRSGHADRVLQSARILQQHRREKALDGNKYDYGPHVKAPKTQSAWDSYQELATSRDALIEKLTSSDGCLPTEWSTANTDQERLALLAKDDGPFNGTDLQRTAKTLLGDLTDLEEDFTTTLIAKELETPRETKVLHRGEYDQPEGDSLQPDVLSVMGQFPKLSLIHI